MSICPDLRFLLPQPASLYWGRELRPGARGALWSIWFPVRALEKSSKRAQTEHRMRDDNRIQPFSPCQIDTKHFQTMLLLILGFPFWWTSEGASEPYKGVHVYGLRWEISSSGLWLLRAALSSVGAVKHKWNLYFLRGSETCVIKLKYNLKFSHSVTRGTFQTLISHVNSTDLFFIAEAG